MNKTYRKKLRQLEMSAKKSVLDVFWGAYHSAYKGKGLEFDDLREYVPGDDARAICWTKTAQMRRPFVKTFKEERDLIVMLLVDISRSTLFQSDSDAKREYMAKIAALLAFSAIYNHDRVGLVLFSSRVEKYVPPRRGVKHGTRLIQELLNFQGKEMGTDVSVPLAFLLKAVPRRSICFLFSDFFAPSFDRALSLAAKKNDLVLACVRSSQENKIAPFGLMNFLDIEKEESLLIDIDKSVAEFYSKSQKEAWNLFLKGCKKRGATAVSFATDEPFEKKLISFFKEKKRRQSRI